MGKTRFSMEKSPKEFPGGRRAPPCDKSKENTKRSRSRTQPGKKKLGKAPEIQEFSRNSRRKRVPTSGNSRVVFPWSCCAEFLKKPKRLSRIFPLPPEFRAEKSGNLLFDPVFPLGFGVGSVPENPGIKRIPGWDSKGLEIPRVGLKTPDRIPEFCME